MAVARRFKPTRVHHSKPPHPQTRGVAEKAVRDTTGQVRKIKVPLDRRTESKVSADAPVVDRIIEHVFTVLNACQVGHDGRTAGCISKATRTLKSNSVNKFSPSRLRRELVSEGKRHPAHAASLARGSGSTLAQLTISSYWTKARSSGAR